MHLKNAVVAQLAERGLPKPEVAGSTPVYRSMQRRAFIYHSHNEKEFTLVYRILHLIAGLCYVVDLLFSLNWFDDWREYVVIGFAGVIASIFGPILFAWIEKIFKNRSDN